MRRHSNGFEITLVYQGHPSLDSIPFLFLKNPWGAIESSPGRMGEWVNDSRKD
jgi:hypothetical protein